MGTMGAFIVFVIAIENGHSYWVAIPIALVFSFILGAALERTLIRPIERRSALGVVIVTLGIFLIINALERGDLGNPTAPAARAVPELSRRPVRPRGGPDRDSPFATERSALGSRCPSWLRFCGSSSKRRSWASAIERWPRIGSRASSSACLSGGCSCSAGPFRPSWAPIAAIMVSQSTNTLDFNLMAVVLLYGFAAAALGGFDSIPGAVVGGMIVGLAEAFIPVVLQLRRVRAEPRGGARSDRDRAPRAARRTVRHEADRARYELADHHRQGLVRSTVSGRSSATHCSRRDLLDRLPLPELPDPQLRAGSPRTPSRSSA